MTHSSLYSNPDDTLALNHNDIYAVQVTKADTSQSIRFIKTITPNLPFTSCRHQAKKFKWQIRLTAGIAKPGAEVMMCTAIRTMWSDKIFLIDHKSMAYRVLFSITSMNYEDTCYSITCLCSEPQRASLGAYGALK